MCQTDESNKQARPRQCEAESWGTLRNKQYFYAGIFCSHRNVGILCWHHRLTDWAGPRVSCPNKQRKCYSNSSWSTPWLTRYGRCQHYSLDIICWHRPIKQMHCPPSPPLRRLTSQCLLRSHQNRWRSTCASGSTRSSQKLLTSTVIRANIDIFIFLFFGFVFGKIGVVVKIWNIDIDQMESSNVDINQSKQPKNKVYYHFSLTVLKSRLFSNFSIRDPMSESHVMIYNMWHSVEHVTPSRTCNTIEHVTQCTTGNTV